MVRPYHFPEKGNPLKIRTVLHALTLALAGLVLCAHAAEVPNRSETGSLAAVIDKTDVQQQSANDRPPGIVKDPLLTKNWLKGERKKNKPTLVMGRSNESALLVGFQARSGKRLLFRSAYFPNGGIVSEVLHWNSATDRIERLIDRSDDIDPTTGKRQRDFKVNGTNLLGHLKAKRDKKPGHEDAGRKVTSFLDTEDGEAFLAAVPAIYVALENAGDSEKKAALKKPFGMWAMMLQMSGERYKGLPDAEQFSNAEKRKRLSDTCSGSDCQLRGQGFVIHRSGFFDILGKAHGTNAQKKATSLLGITLAWPTQVTASRLFASNGVLPSPSLSMESELSCRSQRDNLENNPEYACFGKCGTGCGLIDPKLPECVAHDYCVCRAGSAACMVSIPSECAANPAECTTLVDSVTAVSAYIFASMFDLVENTLDAIAEFVFDVIEFSAEVISDIVEGVIDLVGAFLDWIFESPCVEEEESPEVCS